MAAEVELLSHSWSLPSHSQSEEEPVREALDQGSVSFGRYETESLCWEKKSIFAHDRRQEELDKLTFPGSVAQKKAYFEQYYKKVKSLKGMGNEKGQAVSERESGRKNSSEIECGNENGFENLGEFENVGEVQAPDENGFENENEFESSDEVQAPDETEKLFVVKNADEYENSGEIRNGNETESPIEIQISDEIQVSKDEILVSNDEIQISNESNIDDMNSIAIQEEKEGEETQNNNNNNNNNNIIQEAVPILVRRKTKEKFEHEKKLARAFDSLSKDWVRLKKGMTPIRRNAGAQSENRQKFEKLKNGMDSVVKRSFGTVKDVINNSQKEVRSVYKTENLKLRPIKEQKSFIQSTNLVQKTAKIGTKTRPGTASSCNKEKSSIGTKNLRRVEEKNKKKSVASSSSENKTPSVRSSWESLMRPTAASKARANNVEAKRTNIGVRKPVSRPPKRDSSSVPVPPKTRSFNINTRNKSRPNSDKASRTTERKNHTERKLISSGTKRVIAKKTIDSSTRLRKIQLVSSRAEIASINKRTKINASSALSNRSKQRQERPAWR